MRRFLLLAAMAALAACSGADRPLAVVASTQGTIGPGEQRILVGLVDLRTSEHIASPDLAAVVVLGDENGSPLDEQPAEFIWTVPEVRGLYVARFDIPTAGNYQVTVEAEGYPVTAPSGLLVVEDPAVVEVGEEAPRSVTRVAGDVADLSLITSDPLPDPRFYQMTVAEAVGNGTPAVVVFATPGFCVSQTCGPLLDSVKALAPAHPDVDFVHVEIYQDLQVDSFDQLEPVAAVDEWGLPSEPWVFVIDSAGVVVAAFEGAASAAELEAAITTAGG